MSKKSSIKTRTVKFIAFTPDGKLVNLIDDSGKLKSTGNDDYAILVVSESSDGTVGLHAQTPKNGAKMPEKQATALRTAYLKEGKDITNASKARSKKVSVAISGSSYHNDKNNREVFTMKLPISGYTDSKHNEPTKAAIKDFTAWLDSYTESKKPDGKPATGGTGKPATGGTGKPDGKPDGKPAAGGTGKPDGNPDGNPDGKPAAGGTGKPDGNPDGNPDGKPNGKHRRYVPSYVRAIRDANLDPDDPDYEKKRQKVMDDWAASQF